MATKLKLGPRANSFSDPHSGIQLAPGEVIDFPTGPTSWVLREALKGAHVIKFEEADPIPDPVAPPPVDNSPAEDDLITASDLEGLTRAQIMDKFDFLDSDHVAEAKKKKTVADLIAFLLEVQPEYL